MTDTEERELEKEKEAQEQKADQKARVLLGIDPETMNPEGKNFPNFCRGFLANLDRELCANNTKIEACFNRENIMQAFGLINEFMGQGIETTNTEQVDKIVLQKQVADGLEGFQTKVLDWYDNKSALARLEEHFQVFTIRESTRRVIRSIAKAYLRFYDWNPPWNEASCVSFLNSRNLSSRSRKVRSFYLRTFFKAQGVRKADLPFEDKPLKVDEREETERKTMPHDKVLHFIQRCKESENKEACFYASLVTIYFLRPTELASMTAENIDTENHIIRWQTAKHGRIRTHVIPEEIRPYIYAFVYDKKKTNDKRMGDIWQRICTSIKFRMPAGYSWYSIRHAVVTNLITKSEIDRSKLERFGGWRSGVVSGAGISNIYFTPSAEDMKIIESEIYAKHPFLSAWGNNGNNGNFQPKSTLVNL